MPDRAVRGVVKFIQAKHYRPSNRTEVDWVVLHVAEIAEASGAAESLAKRFAVTDRVASAHYVVDNVGPVQCVHETDIAFHAPGANRNGIGIEMVGRSAQTPEQWADEYSRSVVAHTAALTADICRRRSIPVEFVDAAGLLAGKRGITTHAEATKAWRKSTHTDPGPNFPLERFMALVRTYYDAPAVA